jgi:thioredoxin 2
MAETTTAQATKHLTLRCQFCDTWNRIDASRAADRPKCGKCSKPMLLDRPYPLTEETFARTIQEAEVPVFVDFYANWCGPCKLIANFVDEMAATYQGRALVAKLDTDRAPKTSASLDIRGLPLTMVFKNGREFARQMGAAPKATLVAMLDKSLSEA